MGAGTWESHHAITTLMFRYAEYIDAADFDAIADLFADAVITNEGVDGRDRRRRRDQAALRAARTVCTTTARCAPATSPRTCIVDIDEAAGTATARSSFVVFQQTPTLPLQPIVTRPLPRPVRRGDRGWHFAHRHIVVDHVGDVREHLAFDLAAFHEEHRAVVPRPTVICSSSSTRGRAARRRWPTRSIAGATSDDIDDVEVRVQRAFDATADDVRWCDGIMLGTPENFGYMSGRVEGLLRAHLLRRCSTRRPGSRTRCS